MMNKLIFHLVFCGALSWFATVEAAPVKAEIILLSGRAWEGQILGRSGDMIEFLRGANKVSLGVANIKEIVFNVDINTQKISEMKDNREYEQVVSILEQALNPFQKYSDIPSNLIRYNGLLMELHYKNGNYEKTLSVATKLAADERDTELQEKARVYQALALIGSNRGSEAEKFIAKQGWDLKDAVSPSQLYVHAKLLAEKEQYVAALEQVAKVVAFNYLASDWIQPAELLCAELYVELGMYDSADEVIRQISLLYENSDEDAAARKLQSHIEKLRAGQETL